MGKIPRIICAGSLHWDTIGTSIGRACTGDDVPGKVTRSPGGVAYNIAHVLVSMGIDVELVSVVGTDFMGDQLIETIKEQDIGIRHLLRSSEPTSAYVAVEDVSGVMAAVADCDCIEKNSDRLLERLSEVLELERTNQTHPRLVMDSNLAESQLRLAARGSQLSSCEIRLASASASKVRRILPFAHRPGTVVYLNTMEARALCGGSQDYKDAKEAATSLIALGFERAIVTDGSRMLADCCSKHIHTTVPERYAPIRYTGAGDVLMAAHIYFEINGLDRQLALESACRTVHSRLVERA